MENKEEKENKTDEKKSDITSDKKLNTLNLEKNSDIKIEVENDISLKSTEDKKANNLENITKNNDTTIITKEKTSNSIFDNIQNEIKKDDKKQDLKTSEISLEKNSNIEVSRKNETAVKSETLLKSDILVEKNDIQDITPSLKKEDNNTSKEMLSNIQSKEIKLEKSEIKEQKDSLMDKLLKENNTNKEEKIEKNSLLDSKTNSDLLNNKNSKDFITNIYLNTQKNTMNNQALANKAEAINTVKNANSTKDIEKASDKLDLGLKEIKVENEEPNIKNIVSKKVTNDHFEHRSTLDRLAFNRNTFNDNVKTINSNIENMNILNTNISTISEPEVVVNVPSSLIQNMQMKIVTARQQMQSMMSDVARKMYENYKPPVTAFRINLSPSNLGTIAILMKNDKDNGISISMNISNTNTLDSFIENQNSLKSSLNNSFDEKTEFNLDFTSSEDNQSSNFNDNNNDEENKFNKKEVNTNSILESREDNLEKEDKSLDYM